MTKPIAMRPDENIKGYKPKSSEYSKWNDAHANSEGWGLFYWTIEGVPVCGIQRIDHPLDGSEPIFVDDYAAIAYVQTMADQESEYHKLALELDLGVEY